MISPQEIRTITFEKGMRGYRIEDVDAFMQQIASEMDQLAAEKAEAEKKLYILADKIEEYRKDEDNLKTALLNAQRMGENVIREAKQKAEFILRDAGIKAEDLTRTAREQVEEQETELERVKTEVARFKNTILGLYKEHIESLSRLPGEEELEQEPEEPAAQPAENVAEEPTVAQIISKEDDLEADTADRDPIDSFPDMASFYEEEKPLAPAPAEQVPEEPAEEALNPKPPFQGAFSSFQGIKFSD